MNYAARARLKLLGRLRFEDAGSADAATRDAVIAPDYPGRVERIAIFEVEAFDWNCSQHIVQRFTLAEGQSTVHVTTEVEVAEQIAVDRHAPVLPVDMLPDDTLMYLLQSRYCPSDKMDERARGIVQGVAPGYMQVERIRQWIHSNLEYRYGVSNETTCALDTLRDGAGVCRDFAHVGVALCRSLLIPARVVVGYLYELDPMDMHAWFEAFLGGRWYTFDATQAEPRGGRIVVAHGRDIADVAFMSNYGELEIVEMDVQVRRK